MKLKIHPLYLALAAVLIPLGYGWALLFSAVAALWHEAAHFFVARERGYRMRETVLMPYGAVLNGYERLDRLSETLIAVAGPVASLLAAVMTAALWWIFPSSYAYTRLFFDVNLMLFLFNLLPAFPLDGSRIVLGLSKNRIRALKSLKIAGIVFSLALFALFIVSMFVRFNFTLGIMAVFLFVGAISGTKKELYFSVAGIASEAKDYAHGVEEHTVYIDGDATLASLLKHVGNRRITNFVIVLDGAENKRLSENTLRILLHSHKLQTKIKDVI
ncbi:MAG: hypothetical protein LBT55_05950 [Clostridiaceae bacterium]|jgi:stage IV sporulation protein FB|nr:hypothetical protein [Clostridiaceae bacterium]